MQAEYTYLAIFVLAGFLVILTLWRFIRAAGSTIGQIRFEAERDKYQEQRIAWEREREYQQFRKATRKINGKARNIEWDDGDRRAHRSYHIDDSADEVFDPHSDFRAMDVPTPWGWPSAAGKKINRVGYRGRKSARHRKGNAFVNFFRTKQVVNDEYRAQRELSIRRLVEDRYGRVSSAPQMQEIEWSKPKLPPELIRERATDQVLGLDKSAQSVDDVKEIRALKLVSDVPKKFKTHKKALGE